MIGFLRTPRQQDESYLRLVASLPCLLSGRTVGVQAAHVRYADATRNKRAVGMAEKPDDMWVVPLCQELHVMCTGSQHHAGNEQGWWAYMGVDPICVASLLHSYEGRPEIMEDVVYAFRPRDTMSVQRIEAILRGAR